MVARLPLATINTKSLGFNGVWLAGVFLLAAGGTLIYLTARRRWGRAMRLLTAIFPTLAPALFGLGVASLLNVALATQGLDAAVYNLHLGLLSLIAAGVEALLFGGAF
jgi:hypothetical protein